MKQPSSLEQEYKDLMQQTAPNLWSRIEGNLKEHPERVLHQEEVKEQRETPEKSHAAYPAIYKWMTYGTAAAAAAVFLLTIAGPWFPSLVSVKKHTQTEAEFSDGAAGTSDLDSTEFFNPESTEYKGVIHYSQLDLPAYTSLSLPAQAITLPEDTLYFSEDILGDTQLLCLGTVTSVSLEAESSRHPAFLVYDIRLDTVCYSEDYIAESETVTVKSPVIKADGGSSQILYQLQAGASYLLPLKKQENSWELLFPFAPQIQVTDNGAYLFHSGYTSLTDASTFVVIGEQEGANDFYYDRMLLREDRDFLSDFISLVMAYCAEDI